MAMLVGGAGTEVQMQRYCAGGSTGVDWWPSVSGPSRAAALSRRRRGGSGPSAVDTRERKGPRVVCAVVERCVWRCGGGRRRRSVAARRSAVCRRRGSPTPPARRARPLRLRVKGAVGACLCVCVVCASRASLGRLGVAVVAPPLLAGALVDERWVLAHSAVPSSVVHLCPCLSALGLHQRMFRGDPPKHPFMKSRRLPQFGDRSPIPISATGHRDV